MSGIDYSDIKNMTNEQAAEILKMQLEIRFATRGRGYGKTFTAACVDAALMKAVELLEKTPDA